MRTKVTIKQKPLSEGRKSLYLNFAPNFINPKTNKITRKLYLKEFVYTSGKLTTTEKNHNKNTLRFAEEMRLNFETQANKSEIYNVLEARAIKELAKDEADFIAFFEKYRDTKTGATKILYNSSLMYFKKYTADKPIMFKNITATMLEGFKTYLKTAPSIKSAKVNLSNNTVSDYFGKLRSVIRQAQKDGYLKNDDTSNVKSVKTEETEKNFLTIAELNKVSKTECKLPLLKTVALFSALTGLRFSDIRNLTWDRFEMVGENQYLKFIHQKTKTMIHRQPIPYQAFELMGDPKEPTAKVFEGLTYGSVENNAIKKWILDAGITKKITFHCFRHTYATLQLEAGTDIYTVSKMLGHKDLKTTQVYAKIVDETKQKTTTSINIEY